MFCLNDEDHALLLTFHHICIDEWSLDNIQQELCAHYQANVDEKSLTLGALPCRYADFAQWQRQWFESEAANDSEATKKRRAICARLRCCFILCIELLAVR